MSSGRHVATDRAQRSQAAAVRAPLLKINFSGAPEEALKGNLSHLHHFHLSKKGHVQPFMLIH